MESGPSELNILIVGVGGQGNLLASEIISWASVKQVLKVRVADIFGAAQRGGAVTSHIRIGKDVYNPVMPRDSAHILLGFEPVECLRAANLLRPDCTAIINTRTIVPSSVSLGQATYPTLVEITSLIQKLVRKMITLDAVSLALRAGDALMLNIVMVGALAGTGVTPIRKETFIEAIKDLAPRGTEHKNLTAFTLGFEAVQEKLAVEHPLKRGIPSL
ncbi:MAG TPA: indolepyruvate oxidoreductase subunit beta [archaeon]|nr:indolepyruvate oxidoreductase subunit beta [archaeon]